MKVLADLEICKKIADIKGILNLPCDGNYIYVNVGDEDLPVWEQYNPLSDNDLCMSLSFKFHVSIHYHSGKVFISDSDKGSFVTSFDVTCESSLRKSILLTIIKLEDE